MAWKALNSLFSVLSKTEDLFLPCKALALSQQVKKLLNRANVAGGMLSVAQITFGEIANSAWMQGAGVEIAIRQWLCRIHPNPCIWQCRDENYCSKNNKLLKVEQWGTWTMHQAEVSYGAVHLATTNFVQWPNWLMKKKNDVKVY